MVDILDASPAKDDEGFTEDITVEGKTITITVNDTEVVRWTQPADWTGGRDGPGRTITGPGTIALQAHDPNSTVYYKNIRIRPLEVQPHAYPGPYEEYVVRTGHDASGVRR